MRMSRMLRGGMAVLIVCASLGTVGCARGGANVVPLAVAAAEQTPAQAQVQAAPAQTPAQAQVQAVSAQAPAQTKVQAPALAPAPVPVQAVVVYDSRRVLQQSPLPKAMIDEVGRRFGQREQELNQLFDDYRKEVARFESPTRPKMPKKVFFATKARNQKRGEELTAQRDALLREASEFRSVLTRQTNAFLAKALGAAVQKRNPTIVHDIAAGGVSFYRNDVDITADVLESLNAIWKAAGEGFDLQTNLQQTK